jgi:1-acyl-sn-glycerol-3-phosphate acyltransferase
MSYMDIVLLGSVLKGSFVSKKEVRKWPFVGRAANSIKTIFIERTHEAVPEAQGEVAKTLNQGQSVIMFPESTTGRGDELLPFKRGLLSIAFNNISGVPLNKDALVQPVSLRVTHVDGKDVSTDPSLRRKYSWVGEESILRHIWEMASLESIRVEITAHEPVDPKKFQDKASFVSEIERIVRAGTKGLSPQAP